MPAIGFLGAIPQFCDENGSPIVGGQLSFRQAGGGSAVPVFTDPDLSVAWTVPIILNAAGKPDGPIYLTPGVALMVTLLDADDVPVSGYPSDDYSPAAVSV